MSNEYIRTVSFLVSVHDWEVPETRVQVKKYLRELGENNYIRLMKIRRADKSALSKDFRDISEKLIFAYTEFDDVIEKEEPYLLSHLAVNGSDLKNLFSNEDIGEMLSHLLEIVTENPQLNNKKTLLEKAESLK